MSVMVVLAPTMGCCTAYAIRQVLELLMASLDGRVEVFDECKEFRQLDFCLVGLWGLGGDLFRGFWGFRFRRMGDVGVRRRG